MVPEGVFGNVLLGADPHFSEAARALHYAGICIVGLVVDRTGKPQDVHVVRPVGMGLDEEAAGAVENYRFKPALRKGKAVPVPIKIVVNFRNW